MFEQLESRTLFTTIVLSTSNVTVTETSNSTATVTVKLSKKRASGEVKVGFTTKSSTAISGTNFVAQRGTITIPAGKTSGSATIKLVNDLGLTAAGHFYVDYTSAVHATLPAAGLFSKVTILPGAVTASDLSDNLSNSGNGTQFALGSTELAADFTTSTATTLSSVTIPLEESGTGTATLSIYSDNGSEQPGTLIGTLTSPATFSTALTPTTFTSTNGISLAAGARYWVVLHATSDFNWSFTTNTSGNGTGYEGLWSYSSNDGLSWFTNTSQPLQMSVIVV